MCPNQIGTTAVYSLCQKSSNIPPCPVCVQIVALGWCFGEKAYLRSSWNILDGMLVMISVIDILVSLISNSGTKILGMLRVLRLLRTLRPLR